MPHLLNRHRDEIPANAVWIMRGSKWGNKYIIGKDGTREDCVRKHRLDVENNPELQQQIRDELKGKDLVCCCSPSSCHGNILLEIANRKMPKPKRVIAELSKTVATLPTPQPQTSLWKGPVEDGITYSQLCRFLVCRERFRLYMVEGYRGEPDKFNHAMEYGSLWHEAEEKFAGGKDWQEAVYDYAGKLHKRYPDATRDIIKWTSLCEVQFPYYVAYYQQRNRHTQNREPVAEELKFRVPYKLPDNRIIVLRGKVDCIFKQRSQKSYLVIQENKTKGDIDVEGLQQSLTVNLQTMMYRTVVDTLLNDYGMISSQHANHDEQNEMLEVRQRLQKTKCKVEQTLYNVVRRPLSDRYAPKQKKSETPEDFYKRVGEVIGSNPSRHFFQWSISIRDTHVQRFRQQCLDPILMNLLDWWDSIKAYPFIPWFTNSSPAQIAFNQGTRNKLHHLTPFGIYNNLAVGFRGDFFDYVLKGHKHSLQRVTNLYPELS